MERDCESELSKLNIEQNACIYHFGASVIHGQRSNILRLPSNNCSQTDDTSNLALWLILLFASGGVTIGTTFVSRKKKYNK